MYFQMWLFCENFLKIEMYFTHSEMHRFKVSSLMSFDDEDVYPSQDIEHFIKCLFFLKNLFFVKLFFFFFF